MSKDTNRCLDLIVFQKTSKCYELIFSKDNCALDITGWTIYFTAKKNMKDADVDAVIMKDVTAHFDAIGGRSIIKLSSDDTDIATGSYYFDIKYVDDDNQSEIIISGRLQIRAPVTQRG